MIRKTLALLGLITIALSGCYYDIEDELYPEPCFIPVDIRYDFRIQQIVETNCTTSGCHEPNGTAPGDFTSYNGLLPFLEDGSFENRVVELRTMPPSGELAPCEIEQIKAWLAAGFPE